MDPLTHSTLGVAVALAVGPRSASKSALLLVGLAAGTLPDADIFLRSSTDPLLSLEYHRHFTHSLLFSPVIALLAVAIVHGLMRFFRVTTHCRPLLLPALLAGMSHLFCDAWTSYGTRLGWPFTDTRYSLDWISVVDPLFTLPLLLLTLLAVLKFSRRHARLALVWAGLYLAACVVQQQRAADALHGWLARHGRDAADRIAIHPSFGNIIVWRALAEKDGGVQTFAIRCGQGAPSVVPGESLPIVSQPESALEKWGISPDSPLARDVRRFFHFSSNWVTLVPGTTDTLGDVRYATLPDSLSPLWGIRMLPSGSEPPVEWLQFRTIDAATWDRFIAFLCGNIPEPTDQ